MTCRHHWTITSPCAHCQTIEIATLKDERDRLAGQVADMRRMIVGLANRFVDPATHPTTMREVVAMCALDGAKDEVK
jgi:hypothetical protein